MGRFPRNLGEVFYDALNSVWGGFIMAWGVTILVFWYLVILMIACKDGLRFISDISISDLSNLFSIEFLCVFILTPMFWVFGAFRACPAFGVFGGLAFYFCIFMFALREEKRGFWATGVFCILAAGGLIGIIKYGSVSALILYVTFTVASVVTFWHLLGGFYRRRLDRLNAQADEMAMCRQIKTQVEYKNIEEDL